MRTAVEILPLFYLLCLLVEASYVPSSISDAASDLRDHGWRRKRRKKPGFHLEEDFYPKYFHEPDGSQALHHYDSRYHHATLGYDDKANTQIHLVRSYLEFFSKNHLETWIAHGTLLGWWWNGQFLPWDWDIDTQVSIGTMLYLAENHNATKYTYTSKTDTEFDPTTAEQIPISRKYHLDISPAVYTRHFGEGDNIIDARWIDIRNGLYIDVTALAETHPQETPGIWSCKNYHRYRTRDLWPMRETYFEGMVAKVPYAYTKVLTDEYGAGALVVDEYQAHRWSAPDKVWVKKTPNEIKQERKDKKAMRRKKQEEKAEKLKEDYELQRLDDIRQDREDKEKTKKEHEGRLKEFKDESVAQSKEDEAKGHMREREREREREKRAHSRNIRLEQHF